VRDHVTLPLLSVNSMKLFSCWRDSRARSSSRTIAIVGVRLKFRSDRRLQGHSLAYPASSRAVRSAFSINHRVRR